MRTELAKNIRTIEGIDHRILKITLVRREAHAPLTRLATYAPHQGCKKMDRSAQWGEIRTTLSQIPRHQITIWESDANGQLGRRTKQPEIYHMITGPYTLRGSPEKGNGNQLAQTCEQHKMIPMDTWKGAPLTKIEKQQRKPRNRKKTETARNKAKTSHHLDQPRRENKATNRLHRDQPQVQIHSTKSACRPRVVIQHGPTTTERRSTNDSMSQTHEAIQQELTSNMA